MGVAGSIRLQPGSSASKAGTAAAGVLDLEGGGSSLGQAGGAVRISGGLGAEVRGPVSILGGAVDLRASTGVALALDGSAGSIEATADRAVRIRAREEASVGLPAAAELRLEPVLGAVSLSGAQSATVQSGGSLLEGLRHGAAAAEAFDDFLALLAEKCGGTAHRSGAKGLWRSVEKMVLAGNDPASECTVLDLRRGAVVLDGIDDLNTCMQLLAAADPGLPHGRTGSAFYAGAQVHEVH